MTLNAKTVSIKKETPPQIATGEKVPTTSKNQDEPKPLEDRMHRINQLWQLQGKHQRLCESKARLKKFLTESESENLSITIKNGEYRGEEFTTKNISVIEEVITCLIKTIDLKIEGLEPQLNW